MALRLSYPGGSYNKRNNYKRTYSLKALPYMYMVLYQGHMPKNESFCRGCTPIYRLYGYCAAVKSLKAAWPSGLGRWGYNPEVPGSRPPSCH